MISLLNDLDNKYASRISEYVIPPATKTNTRWRTSAVVPVLGAALCQLGLALRREPLVGVTGVTGEFRKLEEEAKVAGESLTYGKACWSSLPFTWS